MTPEKTACVMCTRPCCPRSDFLSMKFSYLLAIAVVAPASLVGAANSPILATGWNRDVVVENSAGLPFSSAASSFDIPNNYGFYQAGLSGSTRGLPAGGSFTSLVDGTTV